MKRLMAGVLILGLVALVVTPTPAFANHRGHFWGGFAIGGVTGLVLGSAFAAPYYAPPPVVYQPAPVYVAPQPVYVYPAPVYRPVYASPPWVWNGYGWVWQPGHAR